MSQAAAPVLQKERINIIDSLRGVAILGILLMNIPAFSISGDPFIRNEYGTTNFKVWFYIAWIVDGTQRALFSMLFGAGILLFLANKTQQHTLITPADYFFRRQLWLMFFGLFNIYILLWSGDILFDYGCYGLLMFVFRLWDPKKLLIAAGICFLLMLARENRDLYLDKRTISRGEAIERIDTTLTKLTPRQKEHLSAMKDFRDRADTASRHKRMERRDRMMTGNYSDNYDFRTQLYLNNILEYTYFDIWDVVLFMFIGMAFFKTGILMGKASPVLYAIMCIAGFAVGLFLSYNQLKPVIDAKFNFYEYTRNVSISFFEAGRLFRAFGIFGLLMLLYKSGIFKWFFRLMRPVGQMAFTNYLAHSIIAGIIFYGIGFGLYGQFERYEVYLIVLAIWIAQIIWSHAWLRYFQYGPFEWLWRQLTYWKKLPLKKGK
jgi:uncharacterized protein